MQVSDLGIFIPSISQMCNIAGHGHAGSSPSRTLLYVHSIRSCVPTGSLRTRYLTALARAQHGLFMPEPGPAKCTSMASIVIRVISVERLLRAGFHSAGCLRSHQTGARTARGNLTSGAAATPPAARRDRVAA